MNNTQNSLAEPLPKTSPELNNIILHSLPGIKSAQLLKLLQTKAQEVYVSEASLSHQSPVPVDLNAENQDTLIIAFPDDKPEVLKSADIDTVSDKVLNSSFQWVQKFIQCRMKKRFGQILCLINAAANGLAYEGNINAHFACAQGGLVGLMKTASKEYSKRGIITNVLYIDWHNVSLEEVCERSCSLLKGNTSLKGQVFALDGGKWL